MAPELDTTGRHDIIWIESTILGGTTGESTTRRRRRRQMQLQFNSRDPKPMKVPSIRRPPRGQVTILCVGVTSRKMNSQTAMTNTAQ
jgi:hypothetical protein